jgi:hypothetical protein
MRFFQFLIIAISISSYANLYAEGEVSKDLILGNWKLASIYYSDTSRTRSFDENLKNGITFTKDEVSEIIHKSPSEKPYKMTHSYVIEGNCIMLLQPSEKVCWEVKKITEKNLVLITPIGEYSLIR